ncbi:MAG: cation:proton antiporter [Propionibacteriaceae bacterium]|nr:cation:proton antiporter [Propionibacteriaceae bacterium]
MDILGIILLGVVGVVVVVAVTTLAPKVGVAAPLLLVVLGVGASFLPFMDVGTIDPEWVLGGMLPPLLYATAVNTPIMEFRRDLSTISVFSVILVIVSAVVIGFMMTFLIPGLPLALGIALGAIISPTDAVATSIVRKAGVSTRIVTVLEGEAMLNDASALVVLRSAVAAAGVAANGVTFSLGEAAFDFVYAVVVAVVIGFVVGQLNLIIRSRITHEVSSVALSLVMPFIAFLPAEHIHASGLVAAVIAGLVYGHGSAKHIAPSVRLTEESVWKTLELLIESAIFLLMGLQLVTQFTSIHAARGTFLEAIWIGAICATVIIAVRTAFVSFSLWRLSVRYRRMGGVKDKLSDMQEKLEVGEEFIRSRRERLAGDEPPALGLSLGDELALDGKRNIGLSPRNPQLDEERHKKIDHRIEKMKVGLARRISDLDYLAQEHFNWRDGTILVAAGMRGAVTLAAAQSLPEDTQHRALLVSIAFVVAAGTLVLQGGLLPSVAKWLKVGEASHEENDQQLTDLRAELAQAALTHLDDPKLKRPGGIDYTPEVLENARQQVVTTVELAEIDYCQSADLRSEVYSLSLDLIKTRRRELLKIRDMGNYASEILDIALKELDAEQMSVELLEPRSFDE